MIKSFVGEVKIERRIVLGATLVDLADPATMGDVKSLMKRIKPNFVASGLTWSGADWQAYSLIVDAIVEALGVKRQGQIAYGPKAALGIPPAGEIGYPSLFGIQNMADYVANLESKSAATVRSEFKALAAYANPVGVSPPKMESASSSSGSSPGILWALGLAAVGAAVYLFGR